MDNLDRAALNAWWTRRMELLIWFGAYIHSGSISDLKSGIRIAQAAAARPREAGATDV